MKHLLTPARAVGICFARQHVGVAQLRRSGARWRLETFEERQLPESWFGRGASSSAGLRQALAEMTGDFASSHVPVHVALPDPAVRAAVFELEEMPKSPAAQKSLVEFRFARETNTEGAMMSVSQALGQALSATKARGPGAQLLFGMSIESRWIDDLQNTLRDIGVHAWGVAPAALQRFNSLHDRLIGVSGALVSVTTDSWALLLWDEQGRLRHCSAHWRDPAMAANGDDHRTIAIETARVIVAYVDAHADRAVNDIFVAGGAETEAIAALLDDRASSPSKRLFMHEIIDGCDDRLHSSRTGESAVSAALSL